VKLDLSGENYERRRIFHKSGIYMPRRWLIIFKMLFFALFNTSSPSIAKTIKFHWHPGTRSTYSRCTFANNTIQRSSIGRRTVRFTHPRIHVISRETGKCNFVVFTYRHVCTSKCEAQTMRVSYIVDGN